LKLLCSCRICYLCNVILGITSIALEFNSPLNKTFGIRLLV
jgi:hypothetical protein